MSHVTDIILITMIDDGAIDNPGNPSAESFDVRLKKVDGFAGGNKAMQCDMFIAAINGLDIDDYLARFYSVQWEFPENTQLMLKDEHDDTFSIYVPQQPDRKTNEADNENWSAGFVSTSKYTEEQDGKNLRAKIALDEIMKGG